jgi:hypothetical protein
MIRRPSPVGSTSSVGSRASAIVGNALVDQLGAPRASAAAIVGNRLDPVEGLGRGGQQLDQVEGSDQLGRMSPAASSVPCPRLAEPMPVRPSATAAGLMCG